MMCLVLMLFVFVVFDKIYVLKDFMVLFVIVIGICGMLFGEFVLVFVLMCMWFVCGVLFGVVVYGVGIVKVCEIGSEEGVVLSLMMMIVGVVMVLIVLLFMLLLI